MSHTRHEPRTRRASRPRVGHISFLNCLPLYWGLGRTGALTGLDLFRDTPDQLNAALLAGSLDISPISVAEYLRNADRLLLLPDLAIGSDGPVLSVNLVSRKPIDELDGARIALGSTSRTGVLLAQLLLEKHYAVRADYFRCSPVLDVMLEKADAAVLTGDAALAVRGDAQAGGLHVVDLAEVWREWTGLPMVFAVWAVRVDFADANPELVNRVHRCLLHARSSASAELDELAASAAYWEPFDASTLGEYFRALDFSLGERQLAGLREFAARAAEFGAVPELPTGGPSFVSSRAVRGGSGFRRWRDGGTPRLGLRRTEGGSRPWRIQT
nr:menaquinone biosynthesis protein [Longispora sp. (in: high G+C Gram-positive bacteria)]